MSFFKQTSFYATAILSVRIQVEQEEYDEVVVIKALFLNHDYQ